MCGAESQDGNWNMDECRVDCASLAISFLLEEISGHVTCTACGMTYSRTDRGNIMYHINDYPRRYTGIACEVSHE